MHTRSLTAFALLALAAAGPRPAHSQDLQRPPTWKVRFDRPNTPDSAIYYVDMPPGWHVTTQRVAAILYDPARTGQGNFSLESEIFLFPSERPREAYGVFFGGRDLDGTNQAYVYFLVRGDGSFLVKRRNGSNTETVVDWTQHDAVLPMGSENVKNVLGVHAGGDTVEFLVNGISVTSVPRAGIECNGIVGLRVNHALNLHVTSLTVTAGR